MTISILLVDDDADDRDLMCKALNSLTNRPLYEYLCKSKDVLPFLDAIHYFHDLPSLIVLDLDMPMLSGIEVTKLIKQSYRYSHIPVAIFTASESAVARDKCVAAGANHIFKKPGNCRDLKALAQTLYTLAFVQLVNTVV